MTESKLTKELLNCIALHLSGRQDARGVSYMIGIGVTLEGNKTNPNIICISPNFYVFPNRYRRREADKINIVLHVIKEHFPDLFITDDVKDTIYVSANTSELVTGLYEYQLSVNKKRRRWIRVK